MMEYLETILIIFVEMLCFRLFLDIFVDKRNTIVKEVIFWAIMIAVLCVVNKLPVIFIVKELLSIIVLTLGTYSYYKISITKYPGTIILVHTFLVWVRKPQARITWVIC